MGETGEVQALVSICERPRNHFQAGEEEFPVESTRRSLRRSVLFLPVHTPNSEPAVIKLLTSTEPSETAQ